MPRTVARCLTALAAAGPLSLALAGCGAATEEQGAARAAQAFGAASDPAAACALIAPPTKDRLERDAKADCDQALGDLDLPKALDVRDTHVAGHTAQVELAGDTVFLARFDDGWKIVAAGCTKAETDQSTPYDCVLED